MMILHVRTGKQGSDDSTEIGITESEWAKLTEEERDAAVREALGDILDSWVSPEGEG